MERFILGTAMLLLPLGPLCAQIFDQQSAKQKLLVEQIAVLKAYRLTAQQGYKVCTQGWAQVGASAGRTYALHVQYFAALAAVNPQLLAYVQNHAIVKLTSGH